MVVDAVGDAASRPIVLPFVPALVAVGVLVSFCLVDREILCVKFREVLLARLVELCVCDKTVKGPTRSLWKTPGLVFEPECDALLVFADLVSTPFGVLLGCELLSSVVLLVVLPPNVEQVCCLDPCRRIGWAPTRSNLSSSIPCLLCCRGNHQRTSSVHVLRLRVAFRLHVSAVDEIQPLFLVLVIFVSRRLLRFGCNREDPPFFVAFCNRFHRSRQLRLPLFVALMNSTSSLVPVGIQQ